MGINIKIINIKIYTLDARHVVCGGQLGEGGGLPPAPGGEAQAAAAGERALLAWG